MTSKREPDWAHSDPCTCGHGTADHHCCECSCTWYADPDWTSFADALKKQRIAIAADLRKRSDYAGNAFWQTAADFVENWEPK